MNIWIAASDGLIEKVEEYLNDLHISPNIKDSNGYTPIHAAASYGHIELLRLLVKKYQGHVNITDNDGDTPLHYTEDVSTAKVLLEELGADSTIQNFEGKTAFQVFDDDENPELIQYMRQHLGMSLESNSSSFDNEQLKKFKDSLRCSFENTSEDDFGPEGTIRRQKLEQILQSENVEQGLEQYIRETVRDQLLQSEEQDYSKKRK